MGYKAAESPEVAYVEVLLGEIEEVLMEDSMEFPWDITIIYTFREHYLKIPPIRANKMVIVVFQFNVKNAFLSFVFENND